MSPYLFVISMNVLSKLLDEAAKNGEVGYHPRCKNIDLTHLCFVDDLMVFADGTKRSVEGILKVFEDFDKMTGLKISLEKSTLFMAGISNQKQEEIIQHFPFVTGSLPVRYLGLPLFTKSMTVTDFLSLIEKIRKTISSWKNRFLSYAERLQLINFVITSLSNFWMAAFRLPSACIKEVERLCSAYLCSASDLNGRKAKIAWIEVCKPKKDGGLGIRRLKEVNLVCCLKLVWRILSSNSLWVNWIKAYLIRKGSLWSVSETTQTGSLVWKKILKCKDIAKQLYQVEVKNGKKASFWYESWSSLGQLREVLSDRGYIDLGIPINATVEECRKHRKRLHRVPIFNRVETEIERYTANVVEEEDVSMWKNGKGVYKNTFSAKETWEVIREKYQDCYWYKAVWFKYSTPKFSFILWIAMHGRLSTGERMRSGNGNGNGNVDAACVLCQNPLETLSHLFFDCPYSTQIWENLMKGVLGSQYTSDWRSIIRIALDHTQRKLNLFITRYIFQSTVHTVWRERNRRRQGEDPLPATLLIKMIDTNMRNNFTTIRKKGDREF